MKIRSQGLKGDQGGGGQKKVYVSLIEFFWGVGTKEFGAKGFGDWA